MTESEALQIGREAAKAVAERVGGDKAAITRELDRLADTDRKLFEAFAIAGHLMLSATQDHQH